MPDEMVRVVVGILVAPPVSHLTHQACYRVAQVKGHGLISALLHILLDSGISLVQGVTLSSSSQINHGLSQSKVPFGQADEMHRLLSSYRQYQGLRISHTDVLGSEADQATGDV